MKIKKVSSWALLSLLTFVLLLAGCGKSTETGGKDSEGKVYTIRMPAVVNEENFIAIGYKKFKELVEEKSDGRLKVELFLNGTLASSNEEEFQVLRDGSAEIISFPSFIGAQVGGVDGYNIYDFPFIYGDRDKLFELAEGPLGQEIQTKLEEKNNVKVLGYYDIGSMSLLNSKHAIKKPSDLNGLTLRTPQSALFMDTISEMGGNPTPITFAEVYTSLQQGTIDGLTTTLPLMYDSQFFEVSKFATLTKQNFIPYVMTMNGDFFNKLPKDLQNVVVEASKEMVQFSRNLVVEQEVTAVKNLESEGVEIYELSPDEFEEFKKSVQPAIEKNIKLVGKEFYEKTLDFLSK
ncbi:TRAP transporter substrate-binding protein [Neobacillus sp. FSL H8-0543]|uniref:TRAP transporter substrate-binding protein n=1 Tax=Neobacillus sp. FSL H8-0543 TaxID=2954672 RepID=UPI0031584702